MLSTIPAVVVVLALSGGTAAVWLAIAALRRRKAPAAAPDPVLARLNALLGLAWTIFFLVHFVLLATLVESREIGSQLAVVGSAAQGLTLVAALAALFVTLRGQR